MDLLNRNRMTRFSMHPRFEGSNICSWIGFKHVFYLMEEAVIRHFRENALIPRMLFEEFGLCFEIIDSEARILHALHMDDQVMVEVRPSSSAQNAEMVFDLMMLIERDGKSLKALKGKVRVVLRKDGGPVNEISTPPEALQPYVVTEINTSDQMEKEKPDWSSERGIANCADEEIVNILAPDANAFVWKWHIPYFYCHFSERIQHSGYLRLMEEVVDLFLAQRGISIRTMLNKYNWIPVVPNARIRILTEALMEETIYTVYRVEDIFKETIYRSGFDCYVKRNGVLLHTATGNITHGYAVIENRRDWKLVNFNTETIMALEGR